MQFSKLLPFSRFLLMFTLLVSFTSLVPLVSFSADKISLPVRWCGMEGAPSMENPAIVNEASSDNVLWRRHERPTDDIYLPLADISFRSAATQEIKNGPLSFPIIRDTVGTGGDVLSSAEISMSVTQCKRAWLMGDPLYLDDNGNGLIDDGIDTLLSANGILEGYVEVGHDGASLHLFPEDVKYVDENGDGQFNLGEHLYRDENGNNVVDGGDTLLGPGTFGTYVGNINGADNGEDLVVVPGSVKYLDLIRAPANTYNIGYPHVQGITAVSANDFDLPGYSFPLHGVADGYCTKAIVLDDASQYLPPIPDFTLFETNLVGHEFGHSMCLFHGDGINQNGNGQLDEPEEGDPPAFPTAGPGTLCNANNLMQYCWEDNGTDGDPDMNWIGVGAETLGTLTQAQIDILREQAELGFVAVALAAAAENDGPAAHAPAANVPAFASAVQASVTGSSERVDLIRDVPVTSEHIDITTFAVTVENTFTELLLETLRPFPDNPDRLAFYFILDLDENAKTGGLPAEIGAPTDFAGAEVVIFVDFLVNRITEVRAFVFRESTGRFEPLSGANIRVIWETFEIIPDFPRAPIDQITGAPIDMRSGERFLVIIPNSSLEGSFSETFTVEYISHDVRRDVVDRAGSQGMGFKLPVFPDCVTDPEVAVLGEKIDVIGRGLLPNEEVHVLLGADELANGITDENGSVTVPLEIPIDTKTGDRLVTMGAFAVTADCFVTVVRQREPQLAIALDLTQLSGAPAATQAISNAWTLRDVMLERSRTNGWMGN